MRLLLGENGHRWREGCALRYRVVRLALVLVVPVLLHRLAVLLEPRVVVEVQPGVVLGACSVHHRVMSTCWPPSSRPLQYLDSPGNCSSAAGRHS